MSVADTCPTKRLLGKSRVPFLSRTGVPEFSRTFGVYPPSSARRVHPCPLSTLVTSEARFVGSGVRYTQGSENPEAEVVRTVKNSLIPNCPPKPPPPRTIRMRNARWSCSIRSRGHNQPLLIGFSRAKRCGRHGGVWDGGVWVRKGP